MSGPDGGSWPSDPGGASHGAEPPAPGAAPPGTANPAAASPPEPGFPESAGPEPAPGDETPLQRQMAVTEQALEHARQGAENAAETALSLATRLRGLEQELAETRREPERLRWLLRRQERATRLAEQRLRAEQARGEAREGEIDALERRLEAQRARLRQTEQELAGQRRRADLAEHAAEVALAAQRAAERMLRRQRAQALPLAVGEEIRTLGALPSAAPAAPVLPTPGVLAGLERMLDRELDLVRHRHAQGGFGGPTEVSLAGALAELEAYRAAFDSLEQLRRGVERSPAGLSGITVPPAPSAPPAPGPLGHDPRPGLPEPGEGGEPVDCSRFGSALERLRAEAAPAPTDGDLDDPAPDTAPELSAAEPEPVDELEPVEEAELEPVDEPEPADEPEPEPVDEPEPEPVDEPEPVEEALPVRVEEPHLVGEEPEPAGEPEPEREPSAEEPVPSTGEPEPAEAGVAVEPASPPSPPAPPVSAGRPWLPQALRRLVDDDPEVTGEVLVALLAAQHYAYPTPTRYDLRLHGRGFLAVTADPQAGVTHIDPMSGPRPEGEREFLLAGDFPGVARLFTARGFGRIFGRDLARVDGRKRLPEPLKALAAASLSIAQLRHAGVDVAPAVALRLLAIGLMDGVRHRAAASITVLFEPSAGSGGSRCGLLVYGDEPPVVLLQPPAGGATVTVVCPPEHLLAVLAGERALAEAIHGDRSALVTLEGWIAEMQGLPTA